MDLKTQHIIINFNGSSMALVLKNTENGQCGPIEYIPKIQDLEADLYEFPRLAGFWKRAIAMDPYAIDLYIQGQIFNIERLDEVNYGPIFWRSAANTIRIGEWQARKVFQIG